MIQNASSFKTQQNKEPCYKQRTKINSTEETLQANFKGQPRSWEWQLGPTRKKAGLAHRVKSVRMEIKTGTSNTESVLCKGNAGENTCCRAILQKNLKQKDICE